MRFPTPSLSLLLVSSLALLSNCSKICEEDNLPHYTLTADQRTWMAPYPQDAVLRFTNASGYVRTYRVTKAENASIRTGGSKNSFCATYDVEYYTVRLERTDSLGLNRGLYDLALGATKDPAPVKARMQWAGSEFPLPLAEVENGQRVLGPATLAGRTYQHVLDLTYVELSVPHTRAWAIKRLFLTKAEGVIRFEERGGTVWDRL
jgi:hypothetical protein